LAREFEVSAREMEVTAEAERLDERSAEVSTREMEVTNESDRLDERSAEVLARGVEVQWSDISSNWRLVDVKTLLKKVNQA